MSDDLKELYEAANANELTREYLPYDSDEWRKMVERAEREGEELE